KSEEGISMLNVVGAVSIALSIVGVVLLALGRIKLSERRHIEGIPARIMGLLLMASFPLTLGTGLLLEWLLKRASGNFQQEPPELITAGVPAVLLGMMLLMAFILIALTCSRPIKPVRPYIEEDDYEEEDYPLRRGRRDNRFKH